MRNITRLRMLACLPCIVGLGIASIAAAAGELGGMSGTIAHRGASGLAPENTLAAFRKALEIGVDGIELDVQLSKDGAILVYHDHLLKPEITRGPDGEWLDVPGPALRDLTLAELRTYDVGRLRPGTSYGRRYPDQTPSDGERIPTLREVIDLLKAHPGDPPTLWIEIKTTPEQPQISSDPIALTDAVLAILDETEFHEHAVLIAFDWQALVHAQQVSPGIRTGYLSAQQSWTDNIRMGRPGASPWTAGIDVDEHGSVPKAVAAAGGDYWSVYHGDLTPALLAEARELGLKVNVWTLRYRRDMPRIRELAPDSVTTDRPDWLK